MAESLYERLLRQEHSAAVAVYYGRRSISYPALLRNVRKMIGYFRSLGIRQGDVVTVSLPNIPVSVYALYALNAVGAVQNIVHPLAPVPELIRTAKETGSKLVILLSNRCQGQEGEIAESGLSFALANPMHDCSLPLRLFCRLRYGGGLGSDRIFDLERFRKAAECRDAVKRDTAAPCMLLHSGGTTDVPKIIELSDDALNHLAAKTDGILPNGVDGKAMLAVLPAFHGFGLGMGIHTPLYWGATCSLMTRFDVRQTIRWIDEGKVNFIIGVPLLYQKLMKDPAFAACRLQHLECAFIGGDHVPPSLIASFNRLMQEKGSSCLMLEGYGLTETVTVCNVNTTQDNRPYSVGKPLRGIELSIRDEAEQPLPAGTVGEVYVSGDTLMNGYYRDPAATERALRLLDGRQWVRTGDLGYLDEDGFLFLKGRKKRVFKIAGMNIYPSEVERVATDLQEDVFDAALVLFEIPKPHTVLFLVRNKHSDHTEEEIRRTVYEQMERKLLKYCLPQQILFLDTFPKTQVGKTDYKAFKKPES